MFIVLEGGEGSGKSTISQCISDYLTGVGIHNIQTREPGGTKVGERIRQVLLDKSLSDVDPLTELLLLQASRVQHCNQVIKPLVSNGYSVICSRFVGSTIAYQSYGRGIDIGFINSVLMLTTPELPIVPYTILLDCPPEIGLQRVFDNREDIDRFEEIDLNFHKQVREGYLAFLKNPNWFKVDATQDLDTVKEQVINIIQHLLEL